MICNYCHKELRNEEIKKRYHFMTYNCILRKKKIDKPQRLIFHIPKKHENKRDFLVKGSYKRS